MKRLFHFGIDDPCKRLAVWGCACGASSVLLIVWWPLGLAPFGVLLAASLRAAKDAL